MQPTHPARATQTVKNFNPQCRIASTTLHVNTKPPDNVAGLQQGAHHRLAITTVWLSRNKRINCCCIDIQTFSLKCCSSPPTEHDPVVNPNNTAAKARKHRVATVQLQLNHNKAVVFWPNSDRG